MAKRKNPVQLKPVIWYSQTQAWWDEINPVLQTNEFGLISDSDPKEYRIGDSQTRFSDLDSYYLDYMRTIFTGSGSDNTPEGAIIRSGGKHVSKTITLSANNTTANVNVFQLTGTVNCLALHGEITAVTTLNNLTNAYFDLWDGTTSTPITKTTGATMSGYGVGSFFIKDSDSATALSINQNNQGRVKEAGTGTRLFNQFLVTQKLSTNTYIRFNYTTTDAPINAQIKVDLVFVDLDSGELTAV